MSKNPCPDCFGNGYFESSNSRMITKCPKCKGIGVITPKEPPSSYDKNKIFPKETVFK